MHRWKETGETEGNQTLEKKLLLSGTDREEWWPSNRGTHETTFAIELENAALSEFDPVCNRLDGLRDSWKAAWDPRKFLTASIDWQWHAGGIDDLKTGRFPPDPNESRQLRSYALLHWVCSGRPLDYEATVSITHWPKYPLNIRPVRTVAFVSGFSLAEHLDELQWAAAHPYNLKPSAQGCQYCPSRIACEVAE